MSVVDLHWWDWNKCSGGNPFDWLNSNEERPDFLKVRSMANLITRGLRKNEMMYDGQENPRAPVPIWSWWVQPRHPHQLVRITDDNGLMRRPNGGKEYQKSCFICHQYWKEPMNTVWCCSTCGMLLCKKSRQRECTCHDEHKYYNDDPLLGCCKGRDTFVLPKEYRMYKQAGLDLPSLPPEDDLFRSSDNDDENRGNGEREWENSTQLHRPIQTMKWTIKRVRMQPIRGRNDRVRCRRGGGCNQGGLAEFNTGV